MMVLIRKRAHFTDDATLPFRDTGFLAKKGVSRQNKKGQKNRKRKYNRGRERERERGKERKERKNGTNDENEQNRISGVKFREKKIGGISLGGLSCWGYNAGDIVPEAEDVAKDGAEDEAEDEDGAEDGA